MVEYFSCRIADYQWPSCFALTSFWSLQFAMKLQCILRKFQVPEHVKVIRYLKQHFQRELVK